jgi:hypothetical protein
MLVTNYELLSLLVSLLAVVIAAAALYRTRRIDKQLRELRAEQDRLQQEQFQLYQEAAHSKSREPEFESHGNGEAEPLKRQANINVAVENTGTHGVYAVRFNNAGFAPAYKFSYKMESARTEREPLLPPNAPKEVPMLGPGSSLQIQASCSDIDSPPFRIHCFWEDLEGNTYNETLTAHPASSAEAERAM